MPPSKESEALAEHFKKLVSNFPQDGNHILERALYEQIRDVAPEAPGVTVEDVTVRGDGVDIPCKLFKPEGTSSAKHVILHMHGGGFRYSCREPDLIQTDTNIHTQLRFSRRPPQTHRPPRQSIPMPPSLRPLSSIPRTQIPCCPR